MQFASWKTVIAINFLMFMGLGCASAPEPSASPRPWIASKSKLPASSVDAFGVKFTLRASSGAAVNAGLAEIKRISALYDSKTGSELSRINGNAYKQAVVVTPETVNLLGLCERMYEVSDHKFDISFVAPNPDADPSDNAMVDWDHKDQLNSSTQRYFGKQNLLLDPTTRQVRIYVRRTKLNLNGMIRGYAMERATLVMQKAGATGGEVLSDGVVSAFGSELKNTSILCIENPEKLGTCIYRVGPMDFTRPLYLGFSASLERKGAMLFDPKDVWTYRSGGVIVSGSEGAWVQFSATITALMDDGQLLSFLKKDFAPKITAVFFDQNQKTVLKGSLAPYAKVTR